MNLSRRQFLGSSAGIVASLAFRPALTRSTAMPASSAWTTDVMPIPGLGFFTTLVADPFDSSTLVIGGDTHGLRRTTNGGQLWEPIDADLWEAGLYGVAAIVPHPSQQGTYYLLSGSDQSKGAVYKTTDLGDHWTLLHTGIKTQPQTASVGGEKVLRVYGHLLALDATGKGDVLYAASYSDGLYKSTDGGRTWGQPVLAGKNLTAVALDATDPSTVYVGWRSDTNTWTDRTGGVQVSHDAGATWKELISGTDIPVRDLVVDPHSPSDIFVAGLTGGIWHSTDAGSSWVQMNQGLSLTVPSGTGTPVYFVTLEIDPSVPGRRLLGTGLGNVGAKAHGTVYAWEPGASSWTDLVHGNVTPEGVVDSTSYFDLGGVASAVSAIAVPRQPDSTIWVSGQVTAWRSTDGGTSWTSPDAGLEGAGHHFDLAVDPDAPPDANAGRLYFGTVDWALIRSDPTRTSYESVKLTGQTTTTRSLCFAFSPGQLLLGAGDKSGCAGGGVWKGTADGSSWTQSTGLPAARVVGLASAPSGRTTVYAAVTGHGVYMSTDGGESFTAMPTTGLPAALFPAAFTKTVVQVHPNQPEVVYVLDHVAGVYTYSPSARSWSNLSSGVSTTGTAVTKGRPYQGFALDPTRPTNLYLSTCAGLFRSATGGAGWSAVTIPNTEGFGPIAIDPRTGTVLAATALPGESSKLTDQLGIYASTDHGSTWAGAYIDGPCALDITALEIDPVTQDMVWAASSGSMFSVSRSRGR